MIFNATEIAEIQLRQMVGIKGGPNMQFMSAKKFKE